MATLREKLAKAVEQQEYEKAAGYRDEIKALENQQKSEDKGEKSNG
ncbi:MAG: UvrB/UvrC motif-containing protein [Clostridia bacterium]|nr:UvrB/UvrC motif-containing protein [Clostridia bacterium]